MNYKELDVVALVRDVAHYALRRGDRGTIVFVYDPDTFEVEFLFESGETAAVIELTSADIRPATDHDQRAVRSHAQLTGSE